MSHLLYVTIQPPEGTGFDAAFEERNRISAAVVPKVEGSEDVGGGNQFEPVMVDLDFSVPTAVAGATLILAVQDELAEGWAIERVSLHHEEYEQSPGA
jgi:hypothetical protein